MKKTTIEVGDFRGRAMVQPSTLDKEARTVEVVCATETPVRTWTWSNDTFNEVLVCDPSAVDTTRMDNGAPVLNTHNRWNLEDQIGVVDEFRIENRQCIAKVRFSSRDEIAGLVKDIEDGIIRNISIGYKVKKYEKQPMNDGETIPTYRAVSWEPMEVSFVPVPADAGAGVRSQDGAQRYAVEVIERTEENNQPEKIESPKDNMDPIEEPQKRGEGGAGAPTPTPPAPTAEQIRAAEENARKAEQSRVESIRKICETGILGAEFQLRMISENKTVDEVRQLVIEELAKNQAPTSGVRVEGDETDKRREVMTASLVLRADASLAKGMKPELVTEARREYAGITMLDMCKDSLVRAGEDIKGLSKMGIAGRAITSSSSDFPVILEGTNRRILLANYEMQSLLWREFCKVGSVGDFREYKRLRRGSFGDLDTVSENGEYKNKKITDAESEKISAKTKGNIINITRTMIVNDDLSAFTDLAAGLGRAAARSIENDVFAVLLANPTMGDGKALFHSGHGNLLTGAALSVASIEAARVAMSNQKDKDNNDYLAIRPSILLCPVGMGGTARLLNTSQYDPAATTSTTPNIVAGLFDKVLDTPRLSGNAWYMLANPMEEPVFEVVFLDGVETPFMETHEAFNVDGMSWKIRMDYGVGAIGWRGAIKNPGA